MKNFLTILVCLVLAGCWKTAQQPTPAEAIKAGVLDKAFTLGNVPLFEMTCPAEGCRIGSLKVGNPFAVSQLAPIVASAVATPRSEWVDAYIATLGAVKDVGTYATVGHFVSKVMGNITSGFTAGFSSNADIAGAGFVSNANIAGRIPQPGAVTNVHNTLNGDGNIGTGNTFSKITDRHDRAYSCVFNSNSTTGAPSFDACR